MDQMHSFAFSCAAARLQPTGPRRFAVRAALRTSPHIRVRAFTRGRLTFSQPAAISAFTRDPQRIRVTGPHLHHLIPVDRSQAAGHIPSCPSLRIDEPDVYPWYDRLFIIFI
jgi:hypothetical protein